MDFQCQILTCDPEVVVCAFESTFDVDLGDKNYLLDDEGAKDLLLGITKDWINNQNQNNCDNTNDDYYMSINITTTKTDLSSKTLGRRRGKSKGRCKGKNCPKDVHISYPNRRRNKNGSNDPCSVTLLDALQRGSSECLDNLAKHCKTRSSVFDEVQTVDITISGGAVENVENCVLSECVTQREALENFFDDFDLSYDSGFHECTWNHVSCNYDDRLTYINFSNDCEWYILLEE